MAAVDAAHAVDVAFERAVFHESREDVLLDRGNGRGVEREVLLVALGERRG